jgi:hypothetical protein
VGEGVGWFSWSIWAKEVPKIEYRARPAINSSRMITAVANLGLTILYYTVNSRWAASDAHS